MKTWQVRKRAARFLCVAGLASAVGCGAGSESEFSLGNARGDGALSPTPAPARSYDSTRLEVWNLTNCYQIDHTRQVKFVRSEPEAVTVGLDNRKIDDSRTVTRHAHVYTSPGLEPSYTGKDKPTSLEELTKSIKPYVLNIPISTQQVADDDQILWASVGTAAKSRVTLILRDEVVEEKGKRLNIVRFAVIRRAP
jgi:hypothetical protein